MRERERAAVVEVEDGSEEEGEEIKARREEKCHGQKCDSGLT